MTSQSHFARAFLALGLLLLWSGVASAEPAETKPDPSLATTTSDPEIPVDQLELRLRPLSRGEVEVELAAWLGLLEERVQAVSDAEIAVRVRNTQLEASAKKNAADDAQKAALLEILPGLRSAQNGAVDRVDIVVQSFETKGGDVVEARQYLDAVSDVSVDVRDTQAAWAAITGWLSAEDGGLLWGKKLLGFAVIVGVFALLSLLVGRAVGNAVNATAGVSTLMGDFLTTMSRRLVFVVGLFVGLSAIGVALGPVLAIVGAAGFVVAFALQSTLGNFASGLMILFYRPFDEGDVVEVGGVLGTVKSLSLVSTTIYTLDNRVVIVPNNKVWGEIITNVTGSHTRRVDLVFGISYTDDIDKAMTILREVAAKHPLVLEDPATDVRMDSLGDSSVNIVCRPWCRNEDYWTVYGQIQHQAKERFDDSGISIPFPQRDVHFFPAANGATASSDAN